MAFERGKMLSKKMKRNEISSKKFEKVEKTTKTGILTTKTCPEPVRLRSG
jgi:hypothetical protein